MSIQGDQGSPSPGGGAASQRSDSNQPPLPGLYNVSPGVLQRCPWPVRIGSVSVEADEELDASVRRHGILLPILVIVRDRKPVIIAGMRRWASALRTNQQSVPIRVLDVSDEEARAITLLENTARKNLAVWEEIVAVVEYLGVRPNARVMDVREYTGWSDGKAWLRMKIARSCTIAVIAAAHVTEDDLVALTLSDLEVVSGVEDIRERSRVLAERCGNRRGQRIGAASGEDGTANEDAQDSEPHITPGDPITDPVRAPRNAIYSRISTANGRRSLSASVDLLQPADAPKIAHHLLRFIDSLPHCGGLADAVRDWAGKEGIELSA